MFPLDSDTQGAHFLNLTATVQQDHISLNGLYQAGELIPMLLFSVGVQWIEPCVKHVCCLWDVAQRYKDHDLMSALGPTCDENIKLSGLDLLKGASPGSSNWSVNTMIHPSFVAMLFVSTAPVFYMYYEILPMQWIDQATVHWQSSWYGQPCHQVMYPSGQQVCIACFNSKPENAVFVFSANWFATFQCGWVCKPGFAGPNCEITVNLAIYITCTLIAAFLLGGMIFCVLEERRQRRRHVVEEVTEQEIIPTAQRIQPANVAVGKRQTAEMIVFKDNNAAEIRIKLL